MRRALDLADVRRADAIRSRLTEVLHSCSTVTQMRIGLVRLLGDLTEANGLEPTAEECMAPTLRSVAPLFDVDVEALYEQAPSTDSCSSLALEFAP